MTTIAPSPVLDPVDPTRPDETGRAPRMRIWFPLTLVGLYWAYVGVSYVVEMPTFTRFLSQAGVLLGVALIFLIWWSFNRQIGRRDRLIVLAAAIASPIAGKLLSDKTLGPIAVFNGLPLLFTAWTLWLLLARRASHNLWRNGLIIALFLPTCAFALFRMNGLGGEGVADLSWRWSQTAEERYLAQLPSSSAPTTTQAVPVALRPGDWPAFRGPNRDAVVRGDGSAPISVDWEKSPPREVWRRLIGPGWSSVIVVDGRLFTHEQRGESEAVVCLNADTGAEVWSQMETGRFWDALSAAGPRATPTFADGRIYAQGATGTLQCLDAATGRKIWSRNVLADSGGKLPDWGIVSSPLVIEGVVVAYGGGEAGKSLLAYRAETGDLAWAADAGKQSYSSPHAATIAGRRQVLFIGDKGLIAVNPADGKTLWEYASAGNPPRSCQPLTVGPTQLLVPLGMEVPTDLVDVIQDSGKSVATKQWTSRNLKPSFNDFVLHEGYIYGFDGHMFTCVDLKTGARRWKQGRYGTGQAILLADQAALLVLSDEGDVVLVAATPEAHKELGRIKAIEGKTWNHPAFAHGRLYVRNAREMACFEMR